MDNNEYDALIAPAGGTAAPAGNEYDALVGEQAQEQVTGLKTSMTAAVATSPDRAAQARRMATDLNLPQGVVERNFDELSKRHAVATTDYDALIANSPKVAEWSADPNNLALAHDDLKGLSKTELMIKAVADAGGGGANLARAWRWLTAGSEPWSSTLGKGMEQAGHSLNAALGGLEEQVAITRGARTFPIQPDEALQHAKDMGLLPVDAQYDLSRGALNNPQLLDALVQASDDLERQDTARIQQDPLYAQGADRAAYHAQRIQELQPDVPAGSAKYYAGQATQAFFGSILPGMAASIATGGSAAPGLLFMGTQVYGQKLGEQLQAGRTIQEAQADAWFYALAETIPETVPLSIALKKGTPFFKRLLNTTWSEGAQEMLTEVLEAGYDAKVLNQDMTLGQALTRVVDAGIVGAMMGGGMAVAGHTAQQSTDILRARRVQQFFTALGDSAKDSKLRQRLPAAYQGLVETMTKDGPVENVYVPVEAWNTYFQGAKVDPRAMAIEVLGSPAAYDDAVQLGGDIKIPTAAYAAHLAGSEHNAALIPDLKFAPQDLTPREAAAVEEQIKQQAEQTPPAGADAVNAVREDVMGQLVGLGYQRGAAEAYADLYASTFNTLAQRTGQDPLALYQQYGLTIKRPVPDVLKSAGGADALDVLIERLRKGDVPTDTAVRGESLIDFLVKIGGIQDQGGELAALDAKKARRGLVKDTGLTHDDAAAAAVEAGYLTERDPNALLAAIGNEIGGSPVYAPGNARQDLADMQTQLNSLDEYLRQLGVDLNTASNDQIKALLRAETVTPGATEMRQKVYHGSPYAFEKFSLQKIGSGEGAAAYGWGLYFAGKKEVAGFYRDALSSSTHEYKVDGKVEFIVDQKGRPFDVTSPRTRAIYMLATMRPKDIEAWLDETRDAPQSDQKWLREFEAAYNNLKGKKIERIEKSEGRVYEVELADDAIEKMLDWDKKLSQEIKDRLHEMGQYPADLNRITGEQYYTWLVDRLGAPERASKELAALGITGIKYLDSTSRQRGKGSRNYVVFDDRLPKITGYEQGGLPQMVASSASRLAGDLTQGPALTLTPNTAPGEGPFRVTEWLDGQPVRHTAYATEKAAAAGFEKALKASNDTAAQLGEPPIAAEEPGAYQADLFGDPVEPAKPAPAPKLAKNEERVPVRALKTDDKVAGVFTVETAIVAEGHRELPLDSINTVEEAAQAFGYLTNYAVEHFDALVTDKNGVPLAIVGAFKGAIAGTAVYPATVLHEAFRIKGAANIWFLHNHPSGNSSLSRADENLAGKLAEAFQGSEIRARGIFAIAGQGSPHAYTFLNTENDTQQDGQVQRLTKGKVKVPIVERIIKKAEALGPVISSVDDSIALAPSIARETPGILLLDNRHTPIAFVPVKPGEAGQLRTKGRVDRLYRAMSKANAAAGIIVNAGNAYGQDDTDNLANFLQAQDIRTLDVLDYALPLTAGETPSVGSASLRGRQPGTGTTNFRQDQRGAISFGPDRKFDIRVFERADLSTFLHESGHFYLEVLGDLATAENATGQPVPEQLRADYQTLLDWFGVKTREEITVAHHEQFARAFEAYLMEGKAPSVGLRAAFAKFRAWLVAIYRRLATLNVQLTPEVRGVLDRLVATDEEIATAEREGEITPLFIDAAAAGMTEAEFTAYTKTVQDAHEAAVGNLQQKLLAQQRREQEKWYREARAKARLEVEAEVDRQPAYLAAAALGRGTLPDGTVLPDGVRVPKLNRQAIIDAYGIDFLKRLPRPIVYTRDGGVSADAAAEQLGFRSGEELLMALANLRSRRQLIEAETDARLRDRYGDLLLDGTALSAAATQAVEGEGRAKVIATELAALRRKEREVRPFVRAAQAVTAQTERAGRATLATNLPMGQVKAMAEGRVSQMSPRHINPNGYLVALRRAAKQAVELAGKKDYTGALVAKQRELLNLELYRAATDAKEEADKIAADMARYTEDKTRARLGKAGGDYLDQIDALLERFDFKRASNKALDRRRSLAEWIAQKEKNGETLGEELAIPAQLLDEAYRVNYRDLTMEQLRGLHDAVRQIAHFAGLKNKLLASATARDRDEARAELIAAAGANLKGRGPPPLTRAGLTRLEKIGSKGRAFDASLIRMERLITWLDGGDITGPWNRHLWNGASEAQAAELDYSHKITAKLAAAVMAMPAEIRARQLDRVTIAGIERAVTRKDLLGVALNVGNQSNYDKLLKGMGWTEQQVQEMVDRLTPAEIAFVNDMHAIVESMWPDIAQLQKELTGLEPEKIEARAFPAKNGTIKGGYYPVMYDPLASEQGQLQLSATVGNLLEDSYIRATTPRGHTKARIEGFARPFNLDINDLAGHVAGVIKDLTHRKWLIDANWIVNDPAIRAALRTHLGDEYVGLFPDWVRNVVNERNFASMRSLNIWRRGIEQLRYNVMIAAMGFKASTMASQIAGLAPAIDAVGGGEKDGARWMRRAFGEVMRHPRASYQTMIKLSGEMRHRLEIRDRDMRAKLLLLEGRTDTLAHIQDLALHGIGYAELMVSMPAWWAGYRKAIAQGLSVEDAVRYGDRVVRLSQGSGAAKDLAAVMSRSDLFMRTITMFYTPFSALYSQLRDVGHNFHGLKSVPEAAFRLWWVWLVPAILGELLSGHAPDEDKGEDWFTYWLKTTLLYPTLSIPFVRDVLGGAFGNYGYQLSPVAQAGESLARTIRDAKGVAAGDTETEALLKSAFKTSGYLLGLPTGQIEITGGYLFNLAQGNKDPEDLGDFAHDLFYRSRP